MKTESFADMSVAHGNVARRRRCHAAQAKTSRQHWIGWLLLAVLAAACLAIRAALIPWVFMWAMAVSIFAGFKWQTWWEQRCTAPKASWKRSAAYLLLWPGMEAEQFLDRTSPQPEIWAREWLSAALKTIAGTALILASKSALLASRPLVASWVGMAGMVMILHFGTFSLLALAWKRAGIRAEAIMRRPLTSQSLGEFWGKRWNLGFRKLSHDLVFRPLQRRYGVVAGNLGAFLASGLLHELVISVPARAGYGLPTVYFLIQGAGVLVERSPLGQRLRLCGGTPGGIWTVLIVAGPSPLLFHPWFVLRVVLPFLRAI